MKIKNFAPRGNWNRIESEFECPKVETIRGAKPLTAPLTV